MMVRIFYFALLRLHPKSFQARFGNQMLLTFEEARDTEGSARLLLDAILSLFRRTSCDLISTTTFPHKQLLALPV
jgi:hypothetical protein